MIAKGLAKGYIRIEQLYSIVHVFTLITGQDDCVLTLWSLRLTFMAGLECVKGPAQTSRPASLCPKLIPVSFRTSAEQQAAVNHCTAEFPFLSTKYKVTQTCPSFC